MSHSPSIFDDIAKLRESFIIRTGTIPTELHIPSKWELRMQEQFSVYDQAPHIRTYVLDEYMGMKVVKDDESSTFFLK